MSQSTLSRGTTQHYETLHNVKLLNILTLKTNRKNSDQGRRRRGRPRGARRTSPPPPPPRDDHPPRDETPCPPLETELTPLPSPVPPRIANPVPPLEIEATIEVIEEDHNYTDSECEQLVEDSIVHQAG